MGVIRAFHSQMRALWRNLIQVWSRKGYILTIKSRRKASLGRRGPEDTAGTGASGAWTSRALGTLNTASAPTPAQRGRTCVTGSSGVAGDNTLLDVKEGRGPHPLRGHPMPARSAIPKPATRP